MYKSRTLFFTLWGSDSVTHSLQRKLSMPEYKGVDESYRVAMIKYETTQIAAEDLKKYYGALDKVSLFG
jgi:hypothetical protein